MSGWTHDVVELSATCTGRMHGPAESRQHGSGSGCVREPGLGSDRAQYDDYQATQGAGERGREQRG